MSNIAQARSCIESELSHAMQGANYYLCKVKALKKALDELDQISAMASGKGTRGTGKSRSPVAASRVALPTRVAATDVSCDRAGNKTTPRKTRIGQQLPATGRDFWEQLMTAEPKTARDVLSAAVKKIGMPLSSILRDKLAKRMAVTLSALVKAGRINDMGTGRHRRYFRQ